MNKNVLKFGLFSIILVGLGSCKNKENELADQRIAELEQYVDSLKTVSDADREANWDKISEDFDRKSTDANDAVAILDENSRAASQERVTVTTTKYGEFKASMEAKATANATPAKPSQNQLLRDRLFGAGKIGDDMSFAWVNKDNALSVYTSFFEAYKNNKEDFSREDYDEIKLMYEALDTRKNTVEQEGLSSSDNASIASIKMKFGPMFKVNRIGAKSREGAEAKE
jgi:hypothetical protein